MFRYQDRLSRDVERWRKAGWLTDEGANAIRTEVAQLPGSKLGLASALGILGAVLIGFAAMSFVAANWQSMSKLARLGLLFAGLWGSYATAAVLFSRNLRGFGNAAILLGVAIFGASIMLIAQMYHMDGNPPDAVLVWALGALLAGMVARSNPASAAAMVLAMVWSVWEMMISGAVHWAFLPVWAFISSAYFWNSWRAGFHFSMLALSIWIVVLGFVLVKGHSHWLVALIGVAIAVGAALGRSAIDKAVTIGNPLMAYGVAIGFTGFFMMQFVEPVVMLVPLAYGGSLLMQAIVTLGLLIAAIAWGWHADNGAVLWLGYIGFSIEILGLYLKTLGTLLGTSLFFLVAGLLVIVLSWAAYQLHKRQQASEEGQTASTGGVS